jgi:hypothetical protein
MRTRTCSSYSCRVCGTTRKVWRSDDNAATATDAATVKPTPALTADRLLLSWTAQSILSWVAPLLPKQPSQVKKLSKFASGWTLVMRGIDRDATGKVTKHELQVGQPDEWTVEASISKKDAVGVSDSIIQACISYAGQTWSVEVADAADQTIQ